MTKAQRGFTLTELLIAIVVIAILVAIVISVYNGIQAKARNTQTISVVKAYRNALLAYATERGAYPIATTGSVCLGEGYPVGCTGIGYNNSNFNNNIRPYMNNANPLPLPSTEPLAYYGTRTGAVYSYSTAYTFDGVSHPWALVYMIEGHELCSLPNVLTPAVSANWPNFSSNPDPARAGYTERGSNPNTYCMLKLPDPSAL